MQKISAWATKDGTIYKDEHCAAKHEARITLASMIEGILCAYAGKSDTSDDSLVSREDVVKFLIEHAEEIAPVLAIVSSSKPKGDESAKPRILPETIKKT